jgi:hypothetical protein
MKRQKCAITLTFFFSLTTLCVAHEECQSIRLNSVGDVMVRSSLLAGYGHEDGVVSNRAYYLRLRLPRDVFGNAETVTASADASEADRVSCRKISGNSADNKVSCSVGLGQKGVAITALYANANSTDVDFEVETLKIRDFINKYGLFCK